MDTTKLTPFGVFVRKLRLDKQERLKDMAERIDVTPTYLSSVEYGRRIVPQSWVDVLAEIYHLDAEAVDVLTDAIETSRMLQQNKVDVSHLSSDERHIVGKLAKKLPNYTDVERKDLQDLVDD